MTCNPNARFPLGLLLVMVLITEKKNKLRQKLVPYKAMLEGWTGEGLWKHLELSAGKVLECKELNGLFCSSLEDKDAERSEDSAVLASEVSEGSKDTLGAVSVKNWSEYYLCSTVKNQLSLSGN